MRAVASLARPLRRCFGSQARLGAGGLGFKYTELSKHTLLRLTGPDALHLLQGLCTADMSLLEFGGRAVPALYSLILNPAGRVVHDLLIFNLAHRDAPGPDLLLQTQEAAAGQLQTLLKKYKLRKKVEIQNCAESLASYVIYPELPPSATPKLLGKLMEEQAGFVVAEEDISVRRAAVCFVPDPRCDFLGTRFVLPVGEDPVDIVTTHQSKSTLAAYDRTRYALGVGEGPSELIPGKSLPLEVNGDYLQGVSFHKGCYVGQELTARSHHTGVVRKRLLPLRLHGAQPPPPPGSKIQTASGQAAGELRAVGDCGWGLGLLRLNHVLPEDGKERPQLVVIGVGGEAVEAETWIPPWWPESHLAGQVRGFISPSN